MRMLTTTRDKDTGSRSNFHAFSSSHWLWALRRRTTSSKQGQGGKVPFIPWSFHSFSGSFCSNKPSRVLLVWNRVAYEPTTNERPRMRWNWISLACVYPEYLPAFAFHSIVFTTLQTHGGNELHLDVLHWPTRAHLNTSIAQGMQQHLVSSLRQKRLRFLGPPK